MYDMATPQQREVLAKRTDYVGNVVRALDAEYGRFKPTAPSLKRLDPRREARVEQLVSQGANYEVADLIAQQEIERGMGPRALTVAEEPSPEAVEALETRKEGIAGRALARAREGLKQGAAGTAEAIADLTGNEEAARYYGQVGKKSEAFLQQLGEPKSRSPLVDQFENMLNSLAQQGPGLLASLFTGTTLPVLANIGVTSFGQAYSEGKREGQSASESALRASLLTGAEIYFSRFGLSEQIAGMRAAAKGVRTDELADFLGNYFGKAIAKEVPAEMATTAAQFGIEKLPIGLRQEDTAADLIKQLSDTVLQTVLQTGTIGGVAGAAALAKSGARRAIDKLGEGERDVIIPPGQRPSRTLGGESIPIPGRPERTLAPEGATETQQPSVGVPTPTPPAPVPGEGAPPPALTEPEPKSVPQQLRELTNELMTYDPAYGAELNELLELGLKRNTVYTEEDVDAINKMVEPYRKNKLSEEDVNIRKEVSLALEEAKNEEKEISSAPTPTETVEAEAPREPAPAKRKKTARAPAAPAEPPAPFNTFEQQEYDIAQRLLQTPGGKSFGEGILTRLQGPMRTKKPSTQETVDFATEKLKKFETPAKAEPVSTTNTLRDTLRSNTPRERLILDQYTKETSTRRQAEGLAPAGKVLANTDIAITDINEAIRQAGFMPYDGAAISTNAPKEIKELYRLGTIISAGGYSILSQRLAQDRNYKTFSPDKLNKLYAEQGKDLAKIRELLDKLEEASQGVTPPVNDTVRVNEQPPTDFNLQPPNNKEVDALNDTIQKNIDTIASGFLMGDVVRYGNTPGVVVGVEGNMVRYRPDTMKNPKSYVKVPAAKLELVSRPNTNANISFSTKEGYGEKKMQFKIDNEAVIKAHGAQMYGGSLAQVAVKELTQNAFDGVKRAMYEGTIKKGKISVALDSEKRTITVTDNGSGMSEETVDNALFTGEGSDKGDMPPGETSGGFGKAKYAFMTAVDHYYVNTVRDGKRIVVDTDSINIIRSDFTAKRTSAPKKEHGTTTTVTVPESFVDSFGKTVYIWFPWRLEDTTFFNYPLIHDNVEIDFSIDGKKETPAVGANFPHDKYRKLKVDFEWGEADVYFGINPSQNPSHYVLSSGVYQFNHRFMKTQSERIPFDIIVNIKPKVAAKLPEYPFTYERERFKPTHEKDIKALNSYLAMIARGEEMQELQDNFKKIVMLPRLEGGQDLKESSDKLVKLFNERRIAAEKSTPVKPAIDTTVKILPQGGQVVVVNPNGNVITSAEPKSERLLEETFKAEEAAPTKAKFMLSMVQDPKSPAFHSNVSADLIAVGEPYGDPVGFFAELGTLLVEMKELLANSGIYGYDVLKPDNLFFAGISIDKKYGGVHIRVPYKAVYVNPFYDWGSKSLFGVRQVILNTMIHEIAHTGDMSHGVGHNTNMIKVEQYLADEGMLDYFRDAILDILVRHESTFSAMKEEYGKSTTINTGKSLEDYKQSASRLPEGRVGSGAGDEAKAVSAGERPGRGAGVQRPETPSEGEVSGRAGEDGDVEDQGWIAFSTSSSPPPTPPGQKPKFPKPSPPGVSPTTGVPFNQPLPTSPGQQPPTPPGKKKRVAPARGPISGKSKWRTVEDVSKSLGSIIGDALKRRVPFAKAMGELGPALWNPANGKLRRAFLFAATLRQLADITRTKFPQLTTAINIVDKMTSYRLSKLKEAQTIALDWLNAQNKKPEQSTLAGRIMLDATINGKDPDKGPTTPELDAAWASLDPEFKAIYRKVRDYFYNNLQEMIREMKKRVLKLPKAERQEAIRKINEQFAPSKLVFPYFPLRRFGEYWFQVGKGANKEFYEFESEISRELSRRARIRELQAGNAKQKALAETVEAGSGISELFSKNLASTQILKEVQELIDSIVPPTGAAATKTAEDVRDELKDSLNQLIYIMLPQQSMRKMFINRKAIQGASSDMLRVFTDVAVHNAYQMARFKYSEDFINNINKAREYVKEFFKPDTREVYRDYINELEARTKTILSAEDKSLLAKAAGTAGSIVFFTMLSAPFTALLNTVGFAVFAGSKLGGKYGYTKASEVMLKNMGRYWQTAPGRTLKPAAKGLLFEMQFPSIVESGNLSPLLKRAADRFISEEQVNISLTNDIFDLSDRPSELYTTRYNVIKKILGGLFHQSERANREVALMSAFELEYDRLLNEPKRDTRGAIERDANGNPVTYTSDEAFEAAIEEAKHIAGLTLGDFSRQMKSRLFANVPLSVILKFKQYAVMATYNWVRALQLGLRPYSKKELGEIREFYAKQNMSQAEIDRRMDEIEDFRSDIGSQARKELAGILGVTFLFGGLEAMPFFWIVMPIMAAMLASDDEKDDELFDYLNWFRRWASEWMGGMSFARGAVSQVVEGSISERVSLDPKNLFYRDGRYSPDIVEGLIQDVIANAGPVVGLGLNWAEAVKLFNEGQYQRAWEKILPAFFAKPMQAYRYGTEGAVTKSGETQIAPEDFSGWMLAMQAIGLQPEELALKQKRAIQAKEADLTIKAKETAILNRLWLERDSDEGYEAALDKAIDFYGKNPELLPKSGSLAEKIQNSFEKRAEDIAQAEAVGARIDKRLIGRIGQMLETGKKEPAPSKQMTLEEVRKRYPEYDDIPDDELTAALKKKGILK